MPIKKHTVKDTFSKQLSLSYVSSSVSAFPWYSPRRSTTICFTLIRRRIAYSNKVATTFFPVRIPNVATTELKKLDYRHYINSRCFHHGSSPFLKAYRTISSSRFSNILYSNSAERSSQFTIPRSTISDMSRQGNLYELQGPQARELITSHR